MLGDAPPTPPVKGDMPESSEEPADAAYDQSEDDIDAYLCARAV